MGLPPFSEGARSHHAGTHIYSSFDWTKAHDDKFPGQTGSGKPSFKPGQFIRQGKVGAYKDLLTPELEKKLLDRARAELEPECLRFLEIGG